MTAPFDPGLQPERTLLAWRRTCLALGPASLVAVRFTAAEFGAGGVLLGALGVMLAAGAYAAAAVRYRRTHDAVTASSTLAGDGLPFAALTGAMVVLGVACAGYVLSHSGID